VSEDERKGACASSGKMEERPMPVVTVLEFEGVTEAQYEQVGERLARLAPPEGILYHACGPIAGGWRIADVWESPDAWARFLDARYLPAMRASGGPEPSRREAMPTHHAGVVARP